MRRAVSVDPRWRWRSPSHGRPSIQNLTVEYASGRIQSADREFNLDVAASSLVILMAQCGKTTLLSCLGGILRPSGGAIKFGDVDVTSLDARGLRLPPGDGGHRVQAFNLVPSSPQQRM
jgi:putative ABC transport system ATP-binding protein